MIFDEDGEFVGEYLDFFDARESDKLYAFLKLPPPENSREFVVWQRENKPPTPEPEPEPEVEETEEMEEAGENDENTENTEGF